MNIQKELAEIGDLIRSAHLIEAVRNEVHKALNDKSMVVGGKSAEKFAADASKYEMVVVHKGGKESSAVLARRIRANVKDIEVDELVNNVLGIRSTRRGSR